jgi:hypothetical protein
MRQYFSTAIALSILLFAAGCSSNSQSAQQHPACAPGDQYPQCMQMAQTKTPGAAPYGLQSTGPTNPDMQDYDTSYPRNPAVRLITPGISGMPWGGGFIR